MPADIIAKRMVLLRCQLDRNEVGFFHRDLMIQADNPAVQVASWQPDIKPALVTSHALPAMRGLYARPVLIAAQIKTTLSDAALQHALKNTHFYLQGFAVTRTNGTGGCVINPFTTRTAPLRDPQAPSVGGWLAGVGNEVLAAGSLMVQWRSTCWLGSAFSWLDAMAHAWLVITDAAKILLHPYLLVILFLVAALCFLKLHTPLALRGLPLKGLWLQQLYAAAVGMVGLLLLAHAGPFLGWAWMYYAIALWLICCLCYVQRHQPSQATMLGRLTHLAGVLMTISILPCVVKGVLAQYGL